MTDRFVFHGQTTFIEKPRDTVIQDFQNTYIRGDGSKEDQVNTEIGKLVELVLESNDLSDEEKEDVAQALHTIAEQIEQEDASKLSLKGTLEAVQEIVSKAADIAVPAMGIVTIVLNLLGLS